MDGDVIAIVGADLPPEARPNVARAYGGFGCNVCGLICGWVDGDGRCQNCGPLPTETPVLSDHERAVRREREIAERMRRRVR